MLFDKSNIENFRRDAMQDRFAYNSGVFVEAVENGYSKCTLEIEDRHLNAAGVVNGGVVFTLADFAFSAAANGDGAPVTLTLNANISYLSSARGKKLIAEARRVKEGRTAAFYSVEVTDDTGVHVAEMTVTGFKKA